MPSSKITSVLSQHCQHRIPHFQFRHSNGAGSSHQYAVGCADADVNAGKDNEERSSLWQITNDAEIEVYKSFSTDTYVTVDRW